MFRRMSQVASPLLILIAVALCPTAAKAASFACGGKLTTVEKAICKDPRLSQLDERMYALYVPIKKAYPDAVLSQRDWLKYGRNRCADSVCLIQAYESRIRQFELGTFRNWAAINMPEMAAVGAVTVGVNYQASTKGSAAAAQWMRQNKILENGLAFARARYPYPSNLQLVAMNCKTPNAFYLWEREAVVFCYELTERLIQQYQNALSDRQTTEPQALQRLLYAVHYVLQHELGHAALHNRRARKNFGNQESEADNFAAVSLISSSRNDADLIDMLFGVKYFSDVFRQQGLTLDALTDEHDLSERRYYAFACLAAGANAKVAQQFMLVAQFSEAKIRKCQADWRHGKEAMGNLNTQMASTR
ncbi:DUF4344 domain-containing metallopeptidase [Massilia timonae]|uniref:Uncharacterized protein n=1 Tax=Massilia timonae TaxID=47229 RepID=A0A1S2N3T4_9BURK|nr:DUF4344 domain-containing metallopeptidase [Massilia timonae]OIJ39480.1 hypothetical protein LO55_1269 [Massilia timonae]